MLAIVSDFYNKWFHRFEHIFELLNNCDDKFLDEDIHFELFDSIRIKNTFRRINASKYRDIKNCGINGLMCLRGFGSTSSRDLARVIELELELFKNNKIYVNYRQKFIDLYKACKQNDPISSEDFQQLKVKLDDLLVNLLYWRVIPYELEVFKLQNTNNLSIKHVVEQCQFSEQTIRRMLFASIKELTRLSKIKTPFETSLNEYYKTLCEVESEQLFDACEKLKKYPFHRCMIETY